jgi:hypothetical protein
VLADKPEWVRTLSKPPTVERAVRSLATRLRRIPRPVLAGVLVACLAGGGAAAWKPLIRQANQMAAVVIAADPLEFTLAVLAAMAAVLATGGAWLLAVQALGSRADAAEGVARYVVACLAPPKLGNPARIALLARTLPGRRALWAMTGVCGGVSLARLLPLSLVIVGAAASGAVPLWLGLAVAAAVVVGLGLALVLTGRVRNVRLRRLLEGFSLVVRSPQAATLTFASLSVATLAKVAAAAATAAALGVRQPLLAALVLVPALAFGRMLPFIGTAAGTLAVGASHGGVGVGDALSLAVAFSVAEGVGGILCGIAGASQFVRPIHLVNWRRSLTVLRTLRAGRLPAA